ncbi:acetylornithine/succinylornithine family transaminase [bacterium]|nr:acetylornithine/succinylornithine family transaminase [bacterium]
MSTTLQRRADRVLMNTYGPRSLAFSRGRGAWLWDGSGKKYLDLLSGVAVNALGHCPPSVVRAVRAQAGRLMHTSNLYLIEPQVRLAELLVERTFAHRAFFCNSGTEANEAAIKLARKYFFKKRERRPDLVSFRNAFHGRTLGSLSLTMQEKYQKAFRPLLVAKAARYNDLADADRVITPRTAAVFVELVQGEGGMETATATFLSGLRRICSRRGAILVYDEVQTGSGRTGELFAYQQYGERLAPDLLTTAKGLAGGVPIGALLARRPFSEVFEPGDHAATFGGNHLACAAGIAAFSALSSPSFLRSVRSRAVRLWNGLHAIKDRHPDKIETLRGLGFMVGLKLRPPHSSKILRDRLYARRILTGLSGDSVLRLTPPLVLSARDLSLGVRIISEEVAKL